MADTEDITSNPPVQTPNSQGVSTAGGCEGEGNSPLWDGQIIDAAIPPE
jgi:hypothetical protein